MDFSLGIMGNDKEDLVIKKHHKITITKFTFLCLFSTYL